MAVSLSLATDSNSLPLAYQLYPPAEWTDDPQRCAEAGVPATVGFLTKNRIAAKVPRGVVLGEAAYGDDGALRDELSAQNLIYALGIRPLTTVWWGVHQPATAPPPTARGRPRVRVVTAHDDHTRDHEWLVV